MYECLADKKSCEIDRVDRQVVAHETAVTGHSTIFPKNRLLTKQSAHAALL